MRSFVSRPICSDTSDKSLSASTRYSICVCSQTESGTRPKRCFQRFNRSYCRMAAGIMDDLSIKVRDSANVAILDLKGRITIGEPASLLRDKIRETLDSGYRKILLNFGDVSYMDSAGL